MRSDPIGACGPCFSRMPIGRMHVCPDCSSALFQSLATSSSHLDGRFCEKTLNGKRTNRIMYFICTSFYYYYLIFILFLFLRSLPLSPLCSCSSEFHIPNS